VGFKKGFSGEKVEFFSLRSGGRKKVDEEEDNNQMREGKGIDQSDGKVSQKYPPSEKKKKKTQTKLNPRSEKPANGKM